MRPLRATIDLRLAGYRTGGIARYGEELSRALARLDDLDLIPLRAHRDQSISLGSRRLRTPPHHRLERYSLAAELLLNRIKPDVHHAIDFIAPSLPGIPVVATVHDLEFVRHPEYLDAAGREYYGQLAYSRERTAAWITPSQWTADDLCSTFQIEPSKIFVVPHGAPEGMALRPPLTRAERSRYLLVVGTIEPRKRLDLLLDALETMENPPEVRLIGKQGWQAEEVSARIEHSRNVAWLRDVSDPILMDAYRSAWAVLVPSLSEGFGLTALEAMATGTPVLSSGHGALREVTGEAALEPDTDDPAGWAAAIERILDDEHLWNELSLFGQRRAREFDWNRSAKATAEVYRQVAGR